METLTGARELGKTRTLTPGPKTDYRFSLANERTYLAWIRTSVALVAARVAAAKALNFHHDSVRWLVAAPPIPAGSVLAPQAAARWRRYEAAMCAWLPLSMARRFTLIATALSIYALTTLAALALDR
jgi:putative membrane protein